MRCRCLALAILLAGGTLLHPGPALCEGWAPTGNLVHARGNHSATVLGDGRVLVAGGSRASSTYPIGPAEVFDPMSGTWAEAAPLSLARVHHTATLLADGRVLVAGGAAFPDMASGMASTASAEVYDPASDSWTPTGSMLRPRSGHTATALADGTVLVAGGFDFESIDSAELYDPATGRWSAAGRLDTPRLHHSATLRADGSVIVVGGTDDGYLERPMLASAEIYEPSTRTWRAGPALAAARGFHAAAALATGHVVVTGGYDWPFMVHSRVEVLDPEATAWSPAPALSQRRSGHTATVLPDGEILVAGGGPVWETGEGESFSMGSGTWRATGRLGQSRREHTATLLADGRVLVAGGMGLPSGSSSRAGETELASAELYGAPMQFDLCKNHYILRPSCLAPD